MKQRLLLITVVMLITVLGSLRAGANTVYSAIHERIISDSDQDSSIFLPVIRKSFPNHWVRMFTVHSSEYESDYFTSIQEAPSGDIFVSGTTSFGTIDAMIMRLNKEGMPIWQKAYKTAWYRGEHPYFTDILVTQDGGLFLAGNTTLGPGDGTIALAKIDPETGMSLWQKYYSSGSGWDWYFDIKETRDGHLILAGHRSAGDESGTYLLKVTKAGQVVWANSYSMIVIPRDLEILQNGDVIIIGRICLFGPEPWENDCIAKIDGDGKATWLRAPGKAGTISLIKTVTESRTGDLIVTGEFDGRSSVLKMDDQGDIVWQTSFDEPIRELSIATIETNDGAFVLTGELFEPVDEYNNSKKVLLIKLDSEGSVVWQRSYGSEGVFMLGQNDDQAYAIWELADGDLLAAGYTYSFDAPWKNPWLLKLDANGLIENCSIRSSPSYQPIQNSDITVVSVTPDQVPITVMAYDFDLPVKDIEVMPIDICPGPVPGC